MADSEQIRRVDVIAADVFTQPAEEAKILLDQINLVVKGMKEMLAVSSKDLSITTTKDAAEVAKMAAQIKDLEDKIKLLNVVQEKQKSVQKELTIEQAKANIERQKQRQAVTEQAKLESTLTGVYEKQRTRLAQVKRELKELISTEQLATEGAKKLQKEYESLNESVNKTEQSVGEFQRNVGNYTSATQELKALTKQLVDLELAGQRDTKAFRDMSARAGELKDTISDVKAEIKNLGSDTKTIDGVVGTVSLLAGAFETAEGAAILLGGSTEDWKEEMVRLQAVMAVANGIQQVQNALQKESAAMMFLQSIRTKAVAAAQSIYAFATGTASVATNALRISLVALSGIGVIALLYGMADAMGLFSKETDKSTESTKEAAEAQKELNKELEKTKTEVEQQYNVRSKLNKSQLEEVKKGIQQQIDLEEKKNLTILAKNKEKIDQEQFYINENNRKKKQILEDDAKFNKNMTQTELDQRAKYFKKLEYENIESQKTIDKLKLTENRNAVKREEEKLKEINLLLSKFDDDQAKEKPKKQKKVISDELEMNEDAEERELQRKEKITDDLAALQQKEIDDKKQRLEDYEQWLREQAFAEAEIEKERNKQAAIARKEAIKQQQRQQTDQIIAGAKEGVERREEIIQSGIQKELTQTERAIEKQQQLAAQGLENSLAYQEKKRAELEAKAVREKEAARQKEEAIQLAGAYLSAYRSRMDKGNQTSTAALSGALSDVLLAKAISSSVAGAFADGVEDFQGKGTGTSDSNLIAFSHGESVVTAKATKQYSGLVTAMNKGLVDDYVNEMIMPDLDARPSQNGNSFQSAAIIYALNTKLDSLEKAIKNKQEIKVNWDAQGARVEEIVKDGMRVVTKHVTTGKRRL